MARARARRGSARASWRWRMMCALTLLNACSIGFMSYEYAGRYRIMAPVASISALMSGWWWMLALSRTTTDRGLPYGWRWGTTCSSSHDMKSSRSTPFLLVMAKSIMPSIVSTPRALWPRTCREKKRAASTRSPRGPRPWVRSSERAALRVSSRKTSHSAGMSRTVARNVARSNALRRLEMWLRTLRVCLFRMSVRQRVQSG
mmetsp:Transcript_16627/g.43537  ORF Transcript_16627/g.43537 Transcript_16627/m.43537 type:complete len:202 (-) Transcript_16627:394-999(-)